jgi:chromosome partitioning protein
MAYTVAITNQKGGVGKTTTAVNLAAALAVAERRTLLVDADPQGNTTSGVGVAKLELQVSLYDVLVDEYPARDVILPVPGLPHLSLLPATQDLVGAELQLIERPFRESALRRVLEPLEGEYDYIVVDCPPSLGLLTLNVLAAVQQLIIPIQCEYYGLEGISQLLNTVRLVQQNINPGLAIGGVLLTMYDSRLNLCRQVAEDATEYFGSKVFGTPIPRNVRLAEAPSFGKPILLYDVQSVGAKSYLAVAQELLRRVEGTEVTIAPAQVAAVTAQASQPPVASAGASPEAPALSDPPVDPNRPEASTPSLAESVPEEPTISEPASPEQGAPESHEGAPESYIEANASYNEAVPPTDPQDEAANPSESLETIGAEDTIGSEATIAPTAEQQEPVGVSAPVVEGDVSGPVESSDDDAVKPSSSPEPRPEVTT